MIDRFVKIAVILISFFFLTGFITLFSLLGPGITALTSGNIYKAGAQYIANKAIRDSTGKNSLNFIKDKIEKKDVNENSIQELMLLVEKNIKLTRKKLNLKNINQ